jgi:hypothetical protein
MTELGDASNGTSRSGALDVMVQAAAGVSGPQTATISANTNSTVTTVTTLTAVRPA